MVEATAVVVTLAVPDVAPAAIVIVPGVVKAALPDESAIDNPPDGAALLRVTVATLPAPPTTELGLKVTVLIAPAVIVRVA